MITHFYRDNASFSSRIKFQLSLDGGSVVDRMKLADIALITKMLVGSGKGDVWVFHQQRNAVNLFIAALLVKLFGQVKLVYDIHDVNEKGKNKGVKGALSYYVYCFLEWLFFKSGISLLTVSDGLARVYWLRYGRRPATVMNIPPILDIPAVNAVGRAPLLARVVYFGQINEQRLPVQLMRDHNFGQPIDVLGVFNRGHDAYYQDFLELERLGRVKYLGPYHPTDIAERIRGYSASLLVFPGDRINIRFCLPNKFFQSVTAGVPCLVSTNLAELRLKFGRTGFVRAIDDHGDHQALSLTKLNHKIQVLAEESKANYLKAIGR